MSSSNGRSWLHRLLYHILPDPYWTNYCLWKLDRIERKRRPTISTDREKMRGLRDFYEQKGLAEHKKQQGIERARQQFRDGPYSIKLPPSMVVLPDDPPRWLDTSITLKNKYGEECVAVDKECYCQECREARYSEIRKTISPYVRWGVYHTPVKPGMTIEEFWTKYNNIQAIPITVEAYIGTNRLPWNYVMQMGDQVELHRRMGEPMSDQQITQRQYRALREGKYGNQGVRRGTGSSGPR